MRANTGYSRHSLYDDGKDSFLAVAAEEKGPTDAMVKYGVGIIEE